METTTIDTTATDTTATETTATDTTATACRLCEGTGWADPWEAHDGAPALTWCGACLGAGLEDCRVCDGDGIVPEPAECPCVTGELDGVPLAA